MNKQHCTFPYANVCLEEAVRRGAINKFQKFSRIARDSDISSCLFWGLFESSSFVCCLPLWDSMFLRYSEAPWL